MVAQAPAKTDQVQVRLDPSGVGSKSSTPSMAWALTIRSSLNINFWTTSCDLFCADVLCAVFFFSRKVWQFVVWNLLECIITLLHSCSYLFSCCLGMTLEVCNSRHHFAHVDRCSFKVQSCMDRCFHGDIATSIRFKPVPSKKGNTNIA